MMKTFTENDLVRFIYHETSNEETQDVTEARFTDHELEENVSEFNELNELLSGIQLDTPDMVLERIRMYSRNFNAKGC